MLNKAKCSNTITIWKDLFSIVIDFKMHFFSAMQSWIFSIIHPLEIILILWFAAQKTFIISSSSINAFDL